MGRLLLDTQIVLWLANEPERIPVSTHELLLKEQELLFSYASIWELAIKTSIGKLKLAFTLEEFINKAVEKHQLILFPISLKSILHIQSLDSIHKDPFDRVLISQAITEDIPIVSVDSIFDKYPVKRIW